MPRARPSVVKGGSRIKRIARMTRMKGKGQEAKVEYVGAMPLCSPVSGQRRIAD